jgi:hypothetical protein
MDEWAKNETGTTADAERLPHGKASVTTLAHVDFARGIAESKWSEHLVWGKERCYGKWYIISLSGATTDRPSSISHAPPTPANYGCGKHEPGPFGVHGSGPNRTDVARRLFRNVGARLPGDTDMANVFRL